MKRPDCIKHYSEIQEADDSHYPGSEELLSIGSPFGKAFGLTRIGIHHELLKPGRRTSWPHAESHEEEFVYVIEGHPEAWIDGHLYRLNPGDAVGFPSGTGISHTFINNSDADVRLLVVGERSKKENKVFYPLHPNRNEEVEKDGYFWADHPARDLGPHNGRPDPR
ncbi:MAG: cupin domain-containing protein [Bdellovibrionales bacterium]